MQISSIEFWKRKDGSEAANVYALQSGYEVYMSFDLASGLPFDSPFKEGSRPYVKLKRLVDEKISFGEIRK